MGGDAVFPAPRVCVVNLGCRVNRVESDWIEAAFRERGCALVPEEDADLIAVNTCAVTGEAQAKTRKAVRRAATLPRRPLVAVTGCVANLFPSELESLGDNVCVLPAKEELAAVALEIWSSQGSLGGNGERLGCEPAEPAGPGRLKRGVKVQDGCDNRCTYCIVWRARGIPRSADPADVEAQVRRVLAEGAREVELTGINLGRYCATGADGAPLGLGGLLHRLAPLARQASAVIRASSVEPPEVNAELVEAMAEHADVVCAHLHLPLQSGCSATLSRMGRRYDADGFARSVELFRSALPHASVSTDVIVGFPGETDEEFAESLMFCEAMGFSKIHVFRFSARPETPAASMPFQVDPLVLRRRSERLRAVAGELRGRDARARIGSVEPILVERVEGPQGRGTSSSFHDAVVTRPDKGAPSPGLYRCRILSVQGNGALRAAPVE